MNFSCNQQQLSKILNTVSKAVSIRTTTPILKGIYISVNKDNVTFCGSDGNIIIEEKLDAYIKEEGSVVVSANLFKETVRRFSSGNINIYKEDNKIVIKNEKSEHKIGWLPADEFPLIEEMKEKEILNFDKEILKDMIAKTKFAASTDELKGIMRGVLFEIKKDSFNMIAIDGYKMAIVKEPMNNLKELSFVIEANILNEILNILKDNSLDKEINVDFDGKRAIFQIGSTKVSTRILEGKFIDYERILPRNNESKIIINRRELVDATERASILAREGNNNLIKLCIDENLLTITTRTDMGYVKEEVDIEKKGENLEIGFDSKLILDPLKVIDDENIVIEFRGPLDGAFITSCENGNYSYLVLPVRLK
ncbi:MAG: DNA polymerase III subunit beta [Eubacteriales bacterium]|nr:DNA polymerase III subunit beta [Eubacteriales bacterium]MDY3332449.1 DNA polymerase III subunit beta [Gallibacter sp.]